MRREYLPHCDIYFNPRALRGARRLCRVRKRVFIEFQSTRPARGATKRFNRRLIFRGISIHAPCEGRDELREYLRGALKISIHAPCEGRDAPTGFTESGTSYFNPRALRGARLSPVDFLHFFARFQSTRPARGATCLSRTATAAGVFQSTRPARGATRYAFFIFRELAISIHAPCEGRDATNPAVYGMKPVFQSTRPARGATFIGRRGASGIRDFNPRALRGARPDDTGSYDHWEIFQSTRPARGATRRQIGVPSAFRYFNPRALRGARRLL